MTKPVIELKDVYKEYRQYKSNRQIFAHEMLGLDRGRPQNVLKGINIRVDKGEKIALIGKAGIERDVVIEMISGITFPDKGKVRVRGSIASAISFAAGFDTGLTVRENIWIKGYMYGWSKKQIAEKEEQILDFSELMDHADYKLKDLTFGDIGRLGFSMFCENDADIYALGCNLNVGENRHKEKCMERLRTIAEDMDKTMVIANKYLPYGRELCNRAIAFYDGDIVYEGDVRETSLYMSKLLNEQASLESKPDNKDIESNIKSDEYEEF